MKTAVYLDNAASSPPLPEVVEKFSKWLTEYYANPESTHLMGVDSAKAVKNAGRKVLESVNAPLDTRLVWTGTATEATNLAINGYLANFDSGSILTTAIEHKAVLEPIKAQIKRGLKPAYMALNEEGQIDLDALRQQLTELAPVRLIALQHVNNEVGLIQSIEAVCQLRDELAPKAAIFVDGAQSYGKLPIDWKAWKLDFLVTTAHKINAINGTALLLANPARKLTPQTLGGAQQNGLRAGTLNVPGILAFAEAATLACKGMAEHQAHIADLQHYCREKLTEAFGEKITYHCEESLIAPHILSCAIKGCQAAILMRFLSGFGVIVGTGSACMAEAPSGSYVLQALGVKKEASFSTLRISFGFQNTRADVDQLVEALKEAVAAY